MNNSDLSIVDDECKTCSPFMECYEHWKERMDKARESIKKGDLTEWKPKIELVEFTDEDLENE